MSTFDLTQKVKIVTPNASSDSQYGPYNSIGEALTATENLRELGRTVGVIENGEILEYWFKEGITDSDLIPKTTGGGVTDGDKGDIVVSDTGQSWHVHKLLNASQPGKDQIPKVLPDGSIEGEDVMELWVYDDTVTPYDLTDLQTNYPTSAGRHQGFEVRCRLLTPPTTYRKESENDSTWIKIEGSNVV